MAASVSSGAVDHKSSISPFPQDKQPYVPDSLPLVACGKFSESDVADVPSPTVLIIGHPKLRVISPAVTSDELKSDAFLTERRQLHRALHDFRAKHGFGRSIAAPQIGINKRFLAMNLSHGAFTLINPVITWRSEERIRLWDDCMSFPWIMVRVYRHKHISITFQDDHGNHQEWKHLDTATSELLQHEIDHLDGILATDIADGVGGIISREAYDSSPDTFHQQVDYYIVPTIPSTATTTTATKCDNVSTSSTPTLPSSSSSTVTVSA